MKKLLEDESKSRLFKTVVMIIPILMLLIVIFLIYNRTDYEKIERQMTKNAKRYVKENSIIVTNQEYIFIRDLDIPSGLDLCSKASGVVITNMGGIIKYYPYLKCTDYESKILNNNDRYIKLNGPEVVLINKGTLYSDQGYTKKVKDIKVDTVGEVLNEPGAYTINYVVTKNGKQKTIVKRIVIVSDVDTAITTAEFDKMNEPNLVLKGEKEMVLALNSKYEEPGYVAYDYIDGYLTKKVSVEPKKLATDKEGTYKIVYTVENSKGKKTSVERTIKVVKKVAKLTVELATDGSATNESVIEARVYGNGFEKIIFPDGTESSENIATYSVKENGVYTFKVVDKYKNTIIKSIRIDNIDKELPKATCTIEVEDETIIRVVASDNKGILGVNYTINGYDTDFLATTTYRTKEKLTSASVAVKDVAGNITSTTCPLPTYEEVDGYSFKYDNAKKEVSCNTHTDNEIKELGKTLADAVKKSGKGTRAGVVEAARFLVGGFEYKVPYASSKNEVIDPDQVLGVYNKTGLNLGKSGWGCMVNGWKQGLNSLGFVKWAFINAGLTFDEKVEASDIDVSKLKLGDIFVTECSENCTEKYTDMGIIIGIDSDKIYVAEESASDQALVITEVNKKEMPKNGKFSKIIYYKYKSDGNLTDMWK